MRLAVVFMLLLSALLYADPQVVLSTISQDEMQDRLQQLKKMKKGKLDARSKQLLDELWEETSEIAEMNDRCAKLSLTEVDDEECSEFYATRLPEFENKFFQVTGEIRLNSWDLEKGVSQKGQMIQSCYDAFPLESTNPKGYFVPDGSVNPEPLMNGDVEISYRLEMYASGTRLEAVESQIRTWFRSCSPFILRNGEYEFAPMFVQLVKSDDNSASALRMEMANSQRFRVVATKGITATYTLNGETLLKLVIPAGTEIFSVDVYGNVRGGRLEGTSSNGRIQLSKRAMRKGLMGHVEWDESRWAKASATSAAPTYSSQQTAYDDEEPVKERPRYSSSGVHAGFQFRTGIGAGLGGKIDENLKKEYPSIWNGRSVDEKISDSSFVHGYWSWILMLRVYSGSLAMGFGGGGALSWVGVNEAESSSYASKAGDFIYLKTYVDPLAQFELGFRSVMSSDEKDLTYNLEIGVRETVLYDEEWLTALTGGYIKLMDVLDIEIGWHYGRNLSSSVYVALNISLPPHAEN